MVDKLDPGKLAVLDAVRTVLWWALALAAVALGLHFKRLGSRSTGWRLYGAISGCILIQGAYMTLWAVHNAAVRQYGYGRLSDALYRTCIPLYQGAMATFMGLLLLLAAGYSITRNNLGSYKPQVIGLPILLFVTGVVTDYGTFQIFEATSSNLQLFDMPGWQQGLWFVFAFANLAAYGFWVVYMFEIIQVEVDAIKAQQELNLVRNAAPSATVAPFPGSFSTANGGATASSSRQRPDPWNAQQQQQGLAAPQQTHAAPPPGLDPYMVQAAAEEGVVAYKNLLGPGQNMSHVPGADAEGQEINTVADMVNFEVKRKMYARFSMGFGCFMIAQLCVILSPVFVIDVLQEVITFLQFVVVWAFLAVLLWLFRPAQDSPYLLMGDGLDALDTSLGVDDEDEEAGYGGPSSSSGGGRAAAAAANGGHQRGVELTSAAPRSTGLAATKRPSSAAAAGHSSSLLNGGGVDREAGRDQARPATAGVLPVSSGGSGVLRPPAPLPAIKTSVGGAGAGAAAAAAPAAAAAAAAAAPSAQFSLGDEDELHEITLDSARAPPPLEKRD